MASGGGGSRCNGASDLGSRVTCSKWERTKVTLGAARADIGEASSIGATCTQSVAPKGRGADGAVSVVAVIHDAD